MLWENIENFFATWIFLTEKICWI